jgi:2,5-diamino-6-(ribosylamino)-4(3H)-pyrimidinone 5'-phosphate reductase
VVDSLARTPPKSKILSATEGETIIAVSKRAPAYRTRRLEQEGAKIIRCGNKQVDLPKLLQTLKTWGIRSLLLEGGGTLNWSMLNAKLVDELWVTLGPFVVGGEDATTLAEGTGADKMSHAVKLSLQKVKRNGSELMLNYEVRS